MTQQVLITNWARKKMYGLMSILEDKIPMSDLHPLLQYHKLARLLSSDVRNPSKYFDEIGMTSIEYIEDWGPWCPMAAFWPAEEYPY